MVQEDLLARFGDYLQYERRFSIHTVEAYSRDIKQLEEFLNLQYGFSEFFQATHHHVRSWVVSLLKKRLNPVSVKRKLSSITHFYDWICGQGLMENNPVIKVQIPKTPERLPKTISASAIQRLWNGWTSPSIKLTYNSVRDQALIGLLYGCGLRRSELIALKWDDFDRDRNLVRVFGKGRKFRQIPVSPELKKVLEKLEEFTKKFHEKNDFSNMILMDNGKPCYPKYVHKRVGDLLGSVSTAEKRSPHTLRHSMATHMMDEGAELNAVKALLGHSSLAATQVYTHNSIKRLRDVYRQAHPNSNRDA